MAKMTDYTAATRFDSGDILIKDGSGGTKKILVTDAAAEFAGLVSAINHRNIFRGKNLGTSVTAAQKTAIQNGSFDDLFIGDYWVINCVTWRIVDMNYWYNTYTVDYEPFTTHHLVIMPDICLGYQVMNDDYTTVGGYVGSKMYTTGLTQAKTTITNAFGSMVLTHGEYLVNAITNGKPSGATLKASTVEIPSEIMMYGTNIYSPGNDGMTVPSLYTYCKTQLALFDIAPQFIIVPDDYYWLRDVVSSELFAVVDSDGCAGYGNAVYGRGVRPVFSIG